MHVSREAVDISQLKWSVVVYCESRAAAVWVLGDLGVPGCARLLGWEQTPGGNHIFEIAQGRASGDPDGPVKRFVLLPDGSHP